jgi:hypothetical protein
VASEQEGGPKDQSAGAGAKAVARDLKPSQLNERVEGQLHDRSVVSYLFDFRSVGYALLVAIGVGALALLIFPTVAKFLFPIVFLGAWYGFAYALHNEREPTRDPDG